jgi:hypothetical protein
MTISYSARTPSGLVAYYGASLAYAMEVARRIGGTWHEHTA